MFKILTEHYCRKFSKLYISNYKYKKCLPKELLNFFENKTQCSIVRFMSIKKYLDYSKVPKINEDDIEIQFVRGSGPGGQATNKTNNAVLLKHKETGIVVKCHATRSMWDNKKIAMENMTTKLDNLINGEESIEAQTRALQLKKSANKYRKKKKLDELKAAFKKREGLE